MRGIFSIVFGIAGFSIVGAILFWAKINGALIIIDQVMP